MKLKAIYFTTDAYTTVRAQHVRHLVASDKVSLDLDLATQSVSVEDRSPGGEGQYNVPIASLRRWDRAEEPKAVKKAVSQ